MSLIDLVEITKTYDVTPPVPVLRGVNLSVEAGQKVSIIGRSGAGKSTLLNIMGLLDVPSSGQYILDGKHVENVPDRERDRLRSHVLGFVFQDFHVLGHRTVSENLEIKLATVRVDRADRGDRIATVLDAVGLRERANSLARLLSGGEKQRLAIARAMITGPSIILADEPTGNLDSSNAKAVLDLFDDEARRGAAIIVITHDDRLSRWADRVLILDGGLLHER